jgi:hypothetical protein
VPVIDLAHGVGQVFDSPIPLYLYLLGAAATVLVSFGVRTYFTAAPAPMTEREVAGPGWARSISAVLRVGGLVGLVLMVATGVIVGSEGFTVATLGFWVGLFVGVTVLSALLSGAWEAVDPWAYLEEIYRAEGSQRSVRIPPWWLGPAALWALFWFELVSERGFEDWGVLVALLAYTVYALSLRSEFGERWQYADPLGILFGFAARSAPFRLRSEGIYAKNPLADLDQEEPMPLSLYAAVFVLLGSTTFDNLRETVGWGDFLTTTNLDELPAMLVDSVSLLALGLLFWLPFIASVMIARRWIASDRPWTELARWFAWGLVPIGIAYVLAHNVPLLISGAPLLLRELSDPFAEGWNILGTANMFENFIPSPALIWVIEIAVIVGGHILGVLAAHRTAYRLGGTHSLAVSSTYALTGLMAVYTISTLWLLSQPLVA